MQARIPEEKFLLRFWKHLHQARTNSRWDNLTPRRDMLKQFLLLPKQTVSGSLDPMLNSGFVELTDSLLGQIRRRKNGPVSDTEALGP